jgi:YcxB-like protein
MSWEVPFELRVRITFDDYWRATSSYMMRNLKLKWLIVSAAIYLALFFYINFTHSFSGPTYPLLIPLAALGFLYGMLYVNTKSLFAGKKFLQHEVRYVFSEEGIDAIAVGAPAPTSWSAIPKAFELKHDFLIFYTSERMYTIPKRCFAGVEEVKQFRQMLAGRLGNKAKLLG